MDFRDGEDAERWDAADPDAYLRRRDFLQRTAVAAGMAASAGLLLSPETLVAAAARRRGAGSQVTIGMRPEHFDAVPKDVQGVVRVPATVDVVEFLGNEELIHATVAGTDLVALVPAARGLHEGDQVELAIPDTLVYAFDPDNDLVLSADGAGSGAPAAVHTSQAAASTAAPAGTAPAEDGGGAAST